MRVRTTATIDRIGVAPAVAGRGSAVPEAEYADLMMTLRRLKLLAVVLPIAGLIALELTRAAMIGMVSWEKRLALDVVFVAAILIFTRVIFRFIEKMQERLERQNSELRALHDAGLDVSGALSLDVVLKRVVEQARNLVGARYGAVSVIGTDGRIVSFITSGITPEQRAEIGPPPVGHGLLGVVLRGGEHLRLRDLSKDPRSHGFPPNHPPMKSLVAVPIPCKGPFLGNLYLTEKERSAEFDESDHKTLARFATQAALAIDNAHLHEQVADLAVAQERLRIAHEMHDGLAQVLGYVNTKVQAAESYLKRDKREEAGAQLRELSTAARGAYTDVRESIIGLRTLPGPRKTLDEALKDYVVRWEEMSGISASLVIDVGLSLRATHELQLIRIVQESLTNLRKHARASRAQIEIRRTGDLLRATIADDGVGFDAAARTKAEFPRFGLKTMSERAESIGGRLTIDSRPGAGTTVRFELPLEDAVE
jgi:signal transduction histidine kinase